MLNRERVSEAIDAYDFQLVSTWDDSTAEGTPYCYTIGLTGQFDHPEFLISGLEQHKAHSVFKSLVSSIRKGRRFPVGERVDGFFSGFDLMFRELSHQGTEHYLSFASRYYGVDIKGIAILLPDDKNRHFIDEGFKSNLNGNITKYLATH